jgi:RNA polymerase-binding transcription factor DksA
MFGNEEWPLWPDSGISTVGAWRHCESKRSARRSSRCDAKEVSVTELEYPVHVGEHRCRADLDVDDFRADLEHHRQFRVEQLDELTADMFAGSDDALDEVTSALMTAAATALADIDAALHRVDEGCFGFCQVCDSAIAVDRLKALPMASLCMFCQYAKEAAGLDREHSPRRRSSLRPIPLPPARIAPRRQVHREPQPPDIVDVWGCDSFPASDPPANW